MFYNGSQGLCPVNFISLPFFPSLLHSSHTGLLSPFFFNTINSFPPQSLFNLLFSPTRIPTPSHLQIASSLPIFRSHSNVISSEKPSLTILFKAASLSHLIKKSCLCLQWHLSPPEITIICLFFVPLQSQECKLHENLDALFFLSPLLSILHKIYSKNLVKKEWKNFEEKNTPTKHNISYHMFCTTVTVGCTLQHSNCFLTTFSFEVNRVQFTQTTVN